MTRLREWFARPRVQRAFNGWATFFFIALIPVAHVTGIIKSVSFVSDLSLWALVAAHLSAWVGAIVACKQDEDADVQDVIDKLDGG